MNINDHRYGTYRGLTGQYYNKQYNYCQYHDMNKRFIGELHNGIQYYIHRVVQCFINLFLLVQNFKSTE